MVAKIPRGKPYLLERKGQAAIETALALPFLIYLLYYTINAFHSVHTFHVGQKYAAMAMYQRLNNRAQFAVDDVANRPFDRTFIAVQYTNPDGGLPRRRILLEAGLPTQVNATVGVCREPGCN